MSLPDRRTPLNSFRGDGTLGISRRNADPVPEYPLVLEPDVPSFLARQLLTPELNELSPNLWLVATPDSSHISSLHEQIVRGREIVVTDYARLHLLWYRNKVFIKPLPSYLLDDSFRTRHIEGKRELELAATGFLRSYTYLIKCPQDLSIAVQTKLLPQSVIKGIEELRGDGASGRDLFTLLRRYEGLPDDRVSARFRYGDLRLGRINFYNRIFRCELYYQKVYGDYGR